MVCNIKDNWVAVRKEIRTVIDLKTLHDRLHDQVHLYNPIVGENGIFPRRAPIGTWAIGQSR